jgi:hypothetical protein
LTVAKRTPHLRPVPRSLDAVRRFDLRRPLRGGAAGRCLRPALLLLPLLLLLWPVVGTAGPLADALLTSPNFKVRLKAASELGRTRDPQGVAALTRALGDEHALVRGAAASSLGQLQARETVPLICALRADPDAFVQGAAERTLEIFGGPSACQVSKVFVEFEVISPDATLKRFVESQILQRAAQDARVVLGRQVEFGSGTATAGVDPRAEVTAGRLPGVALSLKVATQVQRGAGATRVQCQLGQTVYELRKERILRGSATQRAEIDVGSGSLTDKAIDGHLQECVSALVPVVYDGFGDYLKGVR